MDYRGNLFEKMPFYMTYPMQNLYLAEMEYEKDMERMKELYPNDVRQLQAMVEYRCDQMEYEGSRMYDENPDRWMLEMEVQRLLEEFLSQNTQHQEHWERKDEADDLSVQQFGRGREHTWLRSLIGILFHDEIYRRRCRHRRCSRWW